MAKVADYLLWLWEAKGLSLSSVKLPELGEHHVLRDLLRSFAVERPLVHEVPPSWDLVVVLRHLMSSEYEPLERLSLRALTKKTLFWLPWPLPKGLGSSRPFLTTFLHKVMIYLFLIYLILLLRPIGQMRLCLGFSAFVL